MWGLIHEIIRPATQLSNEAECSCGWHGDSAQLAEHLSDADRHARSRLTEFVALIDEELSGKEWGSLQAFAAHKNYLSTVDFVKAMQIVGFKRVP